MRNLKFIHNLPLLVMSGLMVSSCMSKDDFGNFGRGIFYALAIVLSFVVYVLVDKKTDNNSLLGILCAIGTFLVFGFIGTSLPDDKAQGFGIIMLILILIIGVVYIIERRKNNNE